VFVAPRDACLFEQPLPVTLALAVAARRFLRVATELVFAGNHLPTRSAAKRTRCRRIDRASLFQGSHTKSLLPLRPLCNPQTRFLLWEACGNPRKLRKNGAPTGAGVE
jgi:hypothetical protein